MTCTVCGKRSHKDMHPRCKMGYELGYLRGHASGYAAGHCIYGWRELFSAAWKLLGFGGGESGL